jgi:hypothetical protein
MYKRIVAPLLLLIACCPAILAQAKPPQTKKAAPPATQSAGTDTQKKNIQAYIDLIRRDVRQEKSEIMGVVMLLDVTDAAKFWPIYSDYDEELTKVNNLRSDNILEYARVYTSLTDDKADELIKRALDYQKQRSELLGKYYERVKQELGAITAARFVQVENQLLLIIDLQIASSLPIVGAK